MSPANYTGSQCTYTQLPDSHTFVLNDVGMLTTEIIKFPVFYRQDTKHIRMWVKRLLWFLLLPLSSGT